MTVRELINCLLRPDLAPAENFNSLDAQICVADAPGTILEIVSVYVDEKGVVWLDVEAPR